MHRVLERNLVHTFPLVYRHVNNFKVPLPIRAGINIDNGWFEILWEVSDKLEGIIERMPEEDRPKYAAAQVKEKFGTMRFYMTDATDEMHDVIERVAETRSAITCEMCGDPGMLRLDLGWARTLCNRCHGRFAKTR